MIISFIIPVRNDAARLRRCLESVGRAVAGIDAEILVADNGSTDESAAVARAAGATVVSLPGLRLGALRNATAARARGEILAFVDADHEIARGWPAAAIEILSDPVVAAAGAPYSAPRYANWVQKNYDGLRRHASHAERVEWLGSGNLAVRRSAFRDAGGFDESLDTCEDVDLSRKLRVSGAFLVADERLRSVHHGDPDRLRDIFLGELWRGRDNLRVSFRAPRSRKTIISAVIPFLTLSALVIGVVGALTNTLTGALVAVGAAGLVAALVLARAARIRREAMTRSLPSVAVAAAYELGRACAIAGQATYARRRPTAG